jgi:hypothetical protein
MTAPLSSTGRFGMLALASAIALAALTGCGSKSTPPGKSAPELTVVLSHVDSAVARGDYAAARDALANLSQRTRAERTAGHLTQDQAAQILTAVARLVADLPAVAPVPTPTPTPTATPTPAPPSSPTPSGKAPKKEEKGHKGHDQPHAEGDGGD